MQFPGEPQPLLFDRRRGDVLEEDCVGEGHRHRSQQPIDVTSFGTCEGLGGPDRDHPGGGLTIAERDLSPDQIGGIAAGPGYDYGTLVVKQGGGGEASRLGIDDCFQGGPAHLYWIGASVAIHIGQSPKQIVGLAKASQLDLGLRRGLFQRRGSGLDLHQNVADLRHHEPHQRK